MNEIAPQDYQQWFTVKEFSEKMGIHSTGLTRWLKNNPEFVQKHCQETTKSEKRKTYKIHWKGVAEYIALKNTAKRKRRNEDAKVASLPEAKSNLAERANKTLTHQSPALTPGQALLQAVQLMVGLEEKLSNVEASNRETLEKVNLLEGRLHQAIEVQTNPIPVTHGQRMFLNDQVKRYVKSSGVPYHIAWRQLHEHVGVYGVHNYQMRHYDAAIKYLKKIYAATGLIF